MKILINTPFLFLSGGVANHYLGLKPYWNETIKYNQIGRRKIGNGLWWLLFDILKFITKLVLFKPYLVILNPSLAKTAIKRDAIFLSISKKFNKKCIVFIHGWDINYSNELDKQWFSKKYNKADAFLVLADNFRFFLSEVGIKKPIELTTTKVDDRLLLDFDIKSRNGTIKNLLFLSRIEKAKGVFIAIETFKVLKKKFNYLSLTIVGEGSALSESMLYVQRNRIPDIKFTGQLSGITLANEFKEADLYLFPTYHGEGMPTSVLEAMAFGLPIITRPVGGITDFFQDGKMGFLINSLSEMDFATGIETLINNPILYVEMSKTNHAFARDNFMASEVAVQLESLFKKICNK